MPHAEYSLGHLLTVLLLLIPRRRPDDLRVQRHDLEAPHTR